MGEVMEDTHAKSKHIFLTTEDWGNLEEEDRELEGLEQQVSWLGSRLINVQARAVASPTPGSFPAAATLRRGFGANGHPGSLPRN